MENILEFNVVEKDGAISREAVNVKKLCFGRHCSRNRDATRIHLDEKRSEGYNVHGNPNVCRKSRYLLTNEVIIEVQGPRTSGEVEIVAIMDKGAILISVGGEHSDRSLETMWTLSLDKVYDTVMAKQLVPAVVAKDAWRYEDVKDHWDGLNLKSYVTVSGTKIPYQNFALSDLVDLEYHFRTNPWLKEDGVVFFGGTSSMLPTVPPNVFQFQPSVKGLLFPPDFHFEVYDPVLNRNISHSYRIEHVEEQL